MSKISDAADSVKQFAAQHQAIFDVAVVLGEIGSIEQAAEEAKAARTKAVGELAEVKAELETARTELTQTNAEAKAVLVAAASAANAAIEQARYAAEDIVKAGQADAANLREVATSDILIAKNGAQKTLANTDAQVVAARQTLIDLNIQIDAAKRTLADAEAALASVRESAQRMLG